MDVERVLAHAEKFGKFGLKRIEQRGHRSFRDGPIQIRSADGHASMTGAAT